MSKGELILENIAEVKKLVNQGKTNGEITYDEINEILPDKLLNSEKIDDIFIMLNQLGFEVVEEATRKANVLTMPLFIRRHRRSPHRRRRPCP